MRLFRMLQVVVVLLVAVTRADAYAAPAKGVRPTVQCEVAAAVLDDLAANLKLKLSGDAKNSRRLGNFGELFSKSEPAETSHDFDRQWVGVRAGQSYSGPADHPDQELVRRLIGSPEISAQSRCPGLQRTLDRRKGTFWLSRANIGLSLPVLGDDSRTAVVFVDLGGVGFAEYMQLGEGGVWRVASQWQIFVAD